MSVLARPTKRKFNQLEDRDSEAEKRQHAHFGAQNGPQFVQKVGKSGVPCDPQPFFAPPPGTIARQESPALELPLQRPSVFEPNASIVLIGIRGTGKSSLAVILSAASGRRLIDADQYFKQMTGLSRAELKRQYGTAEYRNQESRVMRLMLNDHKEGCVVACGPASMDSNGRELLKEYAQTHPVAHILRDGASIQSCLKDWDEEKIHHFLGLSGPLYRACSNLEFFNVSDTRSISAGSKDKQQQQQNEPLLAVELDYPSPAITPFLTLKRVERDFLQFIARAVGNARDLRKSLNTFPLSRLPIESHSYTYAISVPLSSLLKKDMDIEDLESTTDAFELRIDMTEDPCDFPSLLDRISMCAANIRRNTIVPLIHHVDPQLPPTAELTATSFGPDRTRLSENTYLSLVEHGARLASDFLTVDLSYSDAVISRIVACKGQSRVIAHFSSSEPSPHSWNDPKYMAMYDRAVKLGCDMVKLSQPAATMYDNFSVQQFRDRIRDLPEPRIPIIAYNSGPLGRLSSCFNPILTPVTHPALLTDPLTHNSPCITVSEAQKALFASFALDPMKFYVFGASVTYSLSPAMHNTAFTACGLPHEYRIYQSPTIQGLNTLVQDPHFGGCSLGLPYKTEVIPLLDSMSPHARAVGAVNTVIPIRTLNTDGSIPTETLTQEKSRAGRVVALFGDNTDWIGMRNIVRRGLSPANAVRPTSTALVVGAGGMAHAAIYAAIQMSVQNIFIYNRSVANALKLAEHYNRQDLHGCSPDGSQATVHVIKSLTEPWPAEYKQPTIIVSCIPQHSIGGASAPNFTLPQHWIESPTGGVVTEVGPCPILFHPLPTCHNC